MRDFPAEGVAWAGVQGDLRLADLLFIAQKANRIAPLQLVRADRVVGADHLRSAAMHARRAFDEGRNHADRLEVEFTRYLAGERQIRRALDKMGLPDKPRAVIVVAFGEKRADTITYFLENLGYPETEGLEAASEGKLSAFGVTEAALEATPEERRLDLALEAVAQVDLLH
ncbi:MAG TPA: KEOPS complex subunit Cgi121 [Candidatus Thermoplasmatota archaeon]|nr:KEOPS complex subunit Cgi121 [Candidatus Thermoplasmatota archaeon]